MDDPVDDTGPLAPMRLPQNGAGEAEPTNDTSPGPFTDAPLTAKAQAYVLDDKQYVHVQLSSDAPRQPIVLIAILDTSGSMDSPAERSDGPGQETAGFSVLDLVKHATMTLAATLTAQDALAIVTYSSTASVVLPPIAMTDSGKARVRQVLSTVRAEGGTNIYEGIRTAAALADSPDLCGRHIVSMLLTDGFPNVNPPRGILPSLKAGQTPRNAWSLHSFAFGYNVDSALLLDLAHWGHGLFGFVPDASMVGTVFINFLAHVLSTAVRDVVVEVPGLAQPVSTGQVTAGQTRDVVLEIPRGQGTPSQVIVNGAAIPVAASSVPPLWPQAHAAYLTAITSACGLANEGGYDKAQVLVQSWYDKYASALQQVAAGGQSPSDTTLVRALLLDVHGPGSDGGQVSLALQDRYYGRWGEHYLRAYQRAQQLQQCMNFKDPGLQIYSGPLFKRIQDEAEQLFLSLAPPTPSLASRRYDSYGGSSGYNTNSNGVSATTRVMSRFHDVNGGCFGKDTLVRVLQATSSLGPQECGVRGGSPVAPLDKDSQQTCWKPIQDLRAGDVLYDPTDPHGKGTRVVALVQCGSQPGVPHRLLQLSNGVLITPYHPVIDSPHDTDDRTAWCPGPDTGPVDRWAFPSDLTKAGLQQAAKGTTQGQPAVDLCLEGIDAQFHEASTVYNLVLDRGHVIEVCSRTSSCQSVPVVTGCSNTGCEPEAGPRTILACTLGHGMAGPVIGHPYFGSQAVVQDLLAMPGWDGATGVVTISALRSIRDGTTGLVCGWYDASQDAGSIKQTVGQ